ncbi:TPA: hypothetical protein ACXYP3_005122 [Escherichia coli]|uniref:hypothetical protein n=1 Tax=Escherichia coli TaxID=562 RepID=UPI0013C32C10|nr:hypothetical protein [Escherichia coli]HAG8425478.1 hypothetical protein [Escherichia coli]HAO9775807.1 hypothetical protein [Escherichia coli O25b:H4-ST131]HAP0895173.1 hypothetical protein [Escherichia coli]
MERERNSGRLRALPLRGRSAVLRIEPVPVSPRLRGQRPLTPPACGLRAPLGLRALPSALALGGWLQRQPGSPVSQLPGHEAVPLAWVVPPMTAVKPGAADCQQTLRSSC